jgi:hypothetical protein
MSTTISALGGAEKTAIFHAVGSGTMVGMQRLGTPEVHPNEFLDDLHRCQRTILLRDRYLLLGVCGLRYCHT